MATFGEDEIYNQADSAGFINLFGYSSPASPTTETTGFVFVNIVVTMAMKLFFPTQDSAKSGSSSFQMR
jgi:hypothetical protein